MTSKPLVRRTRATLRSAEFGFFGVVVYTRVQTPRFCGLSCRAGTLSRALSGWRFLRINWLIVGIHTPFGQSDLFLKTQNPPQSTIGFSAPRGVLLPNT